MSLPTPHTPPSVGREGRKLQASASESSSSEQRWKCADPFGECIMYRLGDGTFSAAGGLFECDHIDPYHNSYCSTRLNLRCVCITCHNLLCRRQRLSALEAAESEGKGESEAEHAVD